MEAGFDAKIYRLAALVPPGFVTTYGQLAALAGRPNCSRRVGLSLSRANESAPCHRVVNSQGRTVPGWTWQKEQLLQEGVTFKANGYVNMRRHRLSAELWLKILRREETEPMWDAKHRGV